MWSYGIKRFFITENLEFVRHETREYLRKIKVIANISEFIAYSQFIKKNLPMQYTVIFKVVNNENQYFSYFCSKHRLWVHKADLTVPTIYVLEQK